jgi:hypothetical protein
MQNNTSALNGTLTISWWPSSSAIVIISITRNWMWALEFIQSILIHIPRLGGKKVVRRNGLRVLIFIQWIGAIGIWSSWLRRYRCGNNRWACPKSWICNHHFHILNLIAVAKAYSSAFCIARAKASSSSICLSWEISSNFGAGGFYIEITQCTFVRLQEHLLIYLKRDFIKIKVVTSSC